jgi:hypothetical protein
LKDEHTVFLKEVNIQKELFLEKMKLGLKQMQKRHVIGQDY